MVCRLAVIVVPLALALAALPGCNKAQGQGGMQMPPPMVTTAPVVSEDVPVYLDEIGKTTATEIVSIVPQVTGKVEKVFFQDGTDLHAGDKLFLIDRRPYQAIADQMQAMVLQSISQSANARTNFDRVAGELPTKAVSQADFDNAKNTLDVANANVKAAQAQTETAQLNLEFCTITSPIDGRAGQKLVDAGNVVSANSTAMLVIQKITPIYVDFTVPEDQLARVREELNKGPMKVEIESPVDSTKMIEGTVTFLDNAVQDGTGTIKLRATVDNKARELWPGQFVHVRLILEIIPHALLIPSEAVQLGQQGQFVYVLKVDPATKATTAEQRMIATGQRQGDDVVATTGLNAGETVIRSGQLMVQPNGPVMLAPPPGQGWGASGAGAKQ